MHQVNSVLRGVQNAVYQYEGAINKVRVGWLLRRLRWTLRTHVAMQPCARPPRRPQFLLDDKGSTLIACFGLPPNAHEDDAARATLAGLAICERLMDLGASARQPPPSLLGARSARNSGSLPGLGPWHDC